MAHKVLVFESDAAFASELRNELGKLGCHIAVVDDGNLGLQQAASEKPDLILLSIELPRMNGFSVCNKLKKDPSLKDVPLIIMSSESSDETFEQHRKLRTRAEDYVHKPISFGELLQHIQSFVRLGGDLGMTNEHEAVHVVDDSDLEEDESDQVATQINQRPAFVDQMVAEAKKKAENADPEIDAAFGRIASEDKPKRTNGASAAPPAAAVTEEINASPVPPPLVEPPQGKSVPPRPAGVDMVEFERMQRESDKAKTRAQELERELASARAEIARQKDDMARESKSSEEAQRLQREIDELRAKLATAGKTGGVSSREFLDLREALNKKDKEILSLKEALTKKDKEIYESRDKSLALERVKSDLDDKVLELDRTIADQREKIEALTADKENAKKVGEDFKARLGRAQQDVEAKQREIGELKNKLEEEVAGAQARVAKLQGEHQQALERAGQEKTQALAQREHAHAAALDEHREVSAREKADALAAREVELRAEADQKLANAQRGHQDEVARVRGEHEQRVQELTSKYDKQLADAITSHERETREAGAKHEAELAAAETRRVQEVEQAQRDGADALARRVEELETARHAEIAALNQAHASKVADLENDRDARIARLEQDRDTRLAEIEEQRDARIAQLESDRNARITQLEQDRDARIAQLENDRDARIAQLESRASRELAEVKAQAEAQHAASEAAIAELTQRLTQAIEERDTHAADLSAARDRITALENDLAATKQTLEDTRARLAQETGRADRATAKWAADKASLDRAKDALAVALSQIEEAEARS